MARKTTKEETMKTLSTLISLILFTILLSGYPSDAQIPRTINYQGSLKYIADRAPVDGLVKITFAIYDSLTGGTHLWSESQIIPVTAGIYSAILGAITPLTLAFDRPYYLELAIDGDTLTPRQPLTSVPYAQRAASMDEITVKNGSVGIHTDTPQYNLDVTGIIRGNTISPADARLKEDVFQIYNALGRLLKLRGVSFRWKITSDQKNPPIKVFTPKGQIASGESFSPAFEEFVVIDRYKDLRMGLIAQEVEGVFPEIVYTDNQGYKSIAYGKLVVPLIEAVKTLNAENTRYQDELTTITEDFERRIAALEAAILQQQ
jgi:hypothetical protein